MKRGRRSVFDETDFAAGGLPHFSLGQAQVRERITAELAAELAIASDLALQGGQLGLLRGFGLFEGPQSIHRRNQQARHYSGNPHSRQQPEQQPVGHGLNQRG
jgi:hypothetical protein